ncbi:hypothetical protein I6I93_05165 [Peptoniphilus harei]|uniref:Uncharacterized protein n=1 Tax=Peptoniphilus harei TaxID=54005 RepID=A0A2X1Y0H6_9FIRM|nr:hypothetical protein [Peptoniphilus harei]MDU3086992.1 hypothetical protein [Peptoniphilus harei]MDU6743337.1 hypothetical protein [Peptoniphilus harei]QQT90311.1 hypothetical protein I6I93_05165 [Peptoniphilus harei]SPY47042.1 Uncharacterised protein [Peptoniphilus harei]
MRKYNYGSIILILIVNAIISGILQNIADGNLSILSGFVAFIFDYIICRGLLYNREGSFSDYFRGIKTMTGKVFLMNILVGAITVVLLTLAALASGAGFLLFSDYAIKDTKIVISLIVLFTLVMIFTSLIFAYLNFFMADERYRDLTFFDSLKLIVKAGIKLFSESFMAGVEAYKITLICGVVAFISLIFVMKGMEILSILAIIFGVIAAIAFFFCTPPFRASLSDIYMDRAEEIYNEVIGCED